MFDDGPDPCSPPDATRPFHALVAIAAQAIRCRTAVLMLIDGDHVWVETAPNAIPPNLPRVRGFCDRTIAGDATLVVGDLRRDARFAHDPLVTGSFGARLYAGTPIRAAGDDGRARPIGAICVLDDTPRTLDEAEIATLEHLAGIAETSIAARGAAIRAERDAELGRRRTEAMAEQDRVFGQAERIAMIGSWRLDIAERRVRWSAGVYRIHDLPVGSPPDVARALDFYPLEDRTRVAAAIDRTIKTGAPFDLVADFFPAAGRHRRVRSTGELDRVDDRAVAVVGVLQDITERYALETSLRRSADTDTLTGLANRAAFDRRLDAALAAARAGGAPLVLALVDLDGFKRINDTVGHQAGDDILRAVGRTLRGDWLEAAFAARIGGDEFALIVEDGALAGQPDRLQDALQQALDDVSILFDGTRVQCSGTVGVGALPRDCKSVRDFVHRIDTILYAAKRRRVGDRRRPARQVA